MKKFLSLVLALVMTMSLVTVSAGAQDFTDDSKITYEEAVDVISAVGVVDGYTDGSFNPTNQLTRGAAAKIICNLILGPTTASALSADAAPFSDVPTSHEFAGYIAYCSQQGIINGYNDGTFRPAAPLTGYAFLKMLLGALGYDGEVEGFTGPNWSIQVGKLALGIGLTDGNDEFVGTQYVNREEACLYSFNTLKADMVRYDAKTSVSVGGAEVVIAGSAAEKIPQNESGYVDTMHDSANVLQFCEKYFPKLSRTNDGTDEFGRPANEWKYKSEIIGSYTDYSDLIGSWTAKAPKSEMYSLVGSSIVSELTTWTQNNQNWSIDDEYTLRVYVDGEELDGANLNAPDKDNYFEKNNSSAAGTKDAVNRGTNVGMSGNGVLTELYMDDDNNVRVVMINTYLVKATADYNSTKENITVEAIDTDETSKQNYNNMVLPNMDTTIDQEDFDVSGVKEGDYLLVTWSQKDDCYVSVEPATLKTGTVTEYTIRDNVVMDGETLKYARLTGDTEQEEQFSINSEASLVLDAYGYILYVDDANSTSSYVYVKSIQGKTNLEKDAVADAYFTDGTTGEIDVKKLYTKSGASYDSGKNIIDNGASGWYTFTKDSSNKYTLTAVKNFVDTTKRYEDTVTAVQGNVASTQIVYSSRVNFLGNVTGNTSNIAPKANEKTLFLVVDYEDDLTVYTGVNNAPDVTLANQGETAPVTYVTDTNGYVKYVFIDLSNNPGADIDGNVVADYMFVLWDNGKITYVEGDEYRQYQVIIDGEETTKFIAESLVGGNGTATGKVFYDIKTNDRDYVTDNSEEFLDHSVQGGEDNHVVVNLADDTITQKNGAITLGSSSFLVDSNTEVYLNVRASDLKKDKGNDYESYVKTTIGTIAGLCTNYEVTGTAYVALDNDWDKTDRADYLFVDITGANKIDTTVIPTLTRTDNNETTFAAGEQAEQLEITVAVEDAGTLTYGIKNSAGTDVVAAGTPVPGTNKIQFYPTANGAAGVAVAETYTVTVTNTKNGTAYTASYAITVTVGAKAITSITATSSQSASAVPSGTKLDKSAITVLATYSDGSTGILGDFDTDPADQTPLMYADADASTHKITVTVTTANGKSDTFEITINAATAVITAAPDTKSLAAGATDSSVAVTITNGGTIDTEVSVAPSDQGGSHTAVAEDVTASVVDGKLHIIMASGLDTGDQYIITISGKTVDGTAATSETVTVTVS